MHSRFPARTRAARSGVFPAAILAAALPAAAILAAPVRAGDAPAWPGAGGTLVLSRPFGRSEIALRLSRRAAGAVDALTWDGVAFLADAGPGDALQAQVTLGPGAGRQAVEGGDGAASAPRLRSLRAGRGWAETVTQLAWTRPDAAPDAAPDAGRGAVPDIVLHKRVGLGLPGLGNAVEIQARFVLSAPASAIRFAPLTAAVPADFTEAWGFDPATGALSRLDPAVDESPHPVILALPEGSHAVGIWSPAPPEGDAGAPRAGFAARGPAGATRLDCHFRVAQAAAGAHDFACYALIGSLADVRNALRSLTAPE